MIPSVLMVEDNHLDYLIFDKMMRKQKFPCDIIWAKDGIEALKRLHLLLESQQIQNLRLIFLDLNLPRMNGFEFLDVYQNQILESRLPEKPTVVLSSSALLKDQERTCEFSFVRAYEEKPLTVSKITRLFQALMEHNPSLSA